MKILIGIDEVGRGPVAGPVAVGAFLLKSKIKNPKLDGKTVPLRDSKKLTRVQREAWYEHLLALQKEGKCDFHVCMQSAAKIDVIGILPCIKKSLAAALEKIGAERSYLILLDGGLKAPEEFKFQKTIIKGDEKEPAIALASIVAKVTRDRYMFRQAKKFPEYGFENHVGYGTRRHYAALARHGHSALHRKTFLKSLIDKKPV